MSEQPSKEITGHLSRAALAMASGVANQNHLKVPGQARSATGQQGAYTEHDDEARDDGPETAQVGISHKAPADGCEETGAHEVGEDCGRFVAGLVQVEDEVGDEVEGNRQMAHRLPEFGHYARQPHPRSSWSGPIASNDEKPKLKSARKLVPGGHFKWIPQAASHP